MSSKTIAVIEGDGIGKEIMSAAVAVLDAVAKKFGDSFTYKPCLLGGAAIDECGTPLPQETLDICKAADSTLLACVGGPKWDKCSVRPEQGLLGIRKALAVFANLRPVNLFDCLADSSPLKMEIIQKGIDLIIVRELIGGIYFGKSDNLGDVAYDTEQYSQTEVERIARLAFEIAQKRRKQLCSVDKANVLASSKLWRGVVDSLAPEYPDVEVSHMYVDNAAMQLIRQPSQFDVIVTSNIFGDILSDEASVLTGSIGLLPSASIAQGGYGLYEPIHGSAPDIAGMGIANPIGMILSAALMLELSLDMKEQAEAIRSAVAKTLEQGNRTKDLDPQNFLSTTDITQKIINNL